MGKDGERRIKRERQKRREKEWEEAGRVRRREGVDCCKKLGRMGGGEEKKDVDKEGGGRKKIEGRVKGKLRRKGEDA